MDAEEAVRSLMAGGIPMSEISVVGRNVEMFEALQGLNSQSDATPQDAETGACFGGVFEMTGIARGEFVIPVVGRVVALGPLARMIAGAVGGAEIGNLVGGLVAAGVPMAQAIKYQARLQAGELLALVRGTDSDMARAHQLLFATDQTFVQTHNGGRW